MTTPFLAPPRALSVPQFSAWDTLIDAGEHDRSGRRLHLDVRVDASFDHDRLWTDGSRGGPAAFTEGDLRWRLWAPGCAHQGRLRRPGGVHGRTRKCVNSGFRTSAARRKCGNRAVPGLVD